MSRIIGGGVIMVVLETRNYVHNVGRTSCFCAGGGRAGCSVKNFYGAKIDTGKLKEVICEILSPKDEIE